jgi:solute carrier family 45, member 1/2/4
MLTSIGMYPVSFAFALQYAHLTTVSLKFGVSETNASLIWLCGPITGLLIQPLVGYLSDKYGTRIPFLTLGSILLILSESIIAYCVNLADKSVAISLLILGFWLFDTGNNMCAVSLRALLTDRLTDEQLQRGFSLQLLLSSLGYISGYYVSQNNSVYTCFIIAALITAGVFSLVISYALLISPATTGDTDEKEEITLSDPEGHEFPSTQKIHQSYHHVKNEPLLQVIFIGSCLSWFGWYSALIYQSHFVSHEIRQTEEIGDERQAMLGMMMGSIISSIVSLVLPLVTRNVFESLYVWGSACRLLGVLLCLSPILKWTGSVDIGVLWLGMFGLVYAVSNSVPFSLIGSNVDEKHRGSILGLLNVAICIPQIITAIFGGPINSEFHSDIPCFLIGGFCSFIAGNILTRYQQKIPSTTATGTPTTTTIGHPSSSKYSNLPTTTVHS